MFQSASLFDVLFCTCINCKFCNSKGAYIIFYQGADCQKIFLFKKMDYCVVLVYCIEAVNSITLSVSASRTGHMMMTECLSISQRSQGLNTTDANNTVEVCSESCRINTSVIWCSKLPFIIIRVTTPGGYCSRSQRKLQQNVC